MNNKHVLAVLFCLLSGLAGFSQKYKTIADTAKLNQEYAQVSKDIADLTTQLNDAKSKQAALQSKAGDVTSSASNALNASDEQATKATSGSVKEARRAKRKAKHAVHAAKDARNARDDSKDQDKKVEKLTKELDKKQKQLEELDGMRTSILSASAQPAQ